MFAARCYASTTYVIMWCLYVFVCPHATFVNSAKTSNRISTVIFNIRWPSFFIPNFMAIFWWEPANRGIKCRWDWQKSRFMLNTWLHRVLWMLQGPGVISTVLQDWQVVTLTAGSKRRSLMTAGDDDEMFMTSSLNVTPKTTEQHLIVRSGKSVAYITVTDCTRRFVVSKLTTYRHEASRSLFATVELLVYKTVK